jgi:hypothetical protein
MRLDTWLCGFFDFDEEARPCHRSSASSVEMPFFPWCLVEVAGGMEGLVECGNEALPMIHA